MKFLKAQYRARFQNETNAYLHVFMLLLFLLVIYIETIFGLLLMIYYAVILDRQQEGLSQRLLTKENTRVLFCCQSWQTRFSKYISFEISLAVTDLVDACVNRNADTVLYS